MRIDINGHHHETHHHSLTGAQIKALGHHRARRADPFERRPPGLGWRVGSSGCAHVVRCLQAFAWSVAPDRRSRPDHRLAPTESKAAMVGLPDGETSRFRLGRASWYARTRPAAGFGRNME